MKHPFSGSMSVWGSASLSLAKPHQELGSDTVQLGSVPGNDREFPKIRRPTTGPKVGL